MHSARFSLPGPVQTVPRAELYCLVWLALNAEPLSIIHYVTDNLNLFNTFNKGPSAGMISSNADLYHTLFATTIDKAMQVTVTWMPSHLTPSEDRPAYVTDIDLKGNACADSKAGQMAKEVCVCPLMSVPQ